VTDLLANAESLWKSGDYVGAWAATEELEPIDKEMEKTAQRIRARAVRRCGILLQEIEKGHGKNKGNRGDASPISITRKDAAAEAGLSPDQAKQSIRVANVPEGDFDCQTESENPPTITNLAEVLKCADDKHHRISCAEYCHARARHHASEENLDEVKRWIAAAIDCWPDVRLQLVDDDLLMGMF